MIDFLDEHDERTDVVIADARARIVPFELFDQPARIINADVELIVCSPQEWAGELAEFARRFSGQDRQLRATAAIDQTIFKVDSNLSIGALEEFLDLAEERLVHNFNSDAAGSSSRLSKRSERSFNARR